MNRSERVCANCDHSRRIAMPAGPELRCVKDPPMPLFAGWRQPQLMGQKPDPIILAAQRVTWADYCCSSWMEMRPDHPNLNAGTTIDIVPTHGESEKVQ